MFRHFIFLVSLLFLLPSLAFSSAVLLETTGKVDLKPGGKGSAKPELGMELTDGTLITTAAGATATVMLMSSEIDKIASQSTYTVGAPPAPEVKKSIISGIALALNEATSDSEAAVAHGMVKMGRVGPGAPEVSPLAFGGIGVTTYFPRYTAIGYSPTIVFRWNHKGLNWTNPVLVIQDANKKMLKVVQLKRGLGEISVSSALVKWTKGASYGWYLGEKTADDVKGMTTIATFRILSDEEQKALYEDKRKVVALGLKNAASRAYILGQLYYKYGLYNDMIVSLRPLWEDKERSTTLKNLLYIGYKIMGMNDEAIKFATVKKDEKPKSKSKVAPMTPIKLKKKK